ncbi:hypothetical protein ABZY05_28095 [Streptomyces canus]|uniref:hypothetical protein n=1 Tax=Streptomyces canus TaxID=58343 RepID=UPI0033AB15D5
MTSTSVGPTIRSHASSGIPSTRWTPTGNAVRPGQRHLRQVDQRDLVNEARRDAVDEVPDAGCESARRVRTPILEAVIHLSQVSHFEKAGQIR